MQVLLSRCQVANTNVQGQDSSVSARADVNVAAASARIANANIAPLDGAHFHVSADLTPGVDAFNVNFGTHKGGGIGVSTRAQVGNVCLSAGPPSLVLGPGLNLGFGRGSSGSGRNAKHGRSGGGNSGDISKYTTEEGREESASMRGPTERLFR